MVTQEMVDEHSNRLSSAAINLSSLLNVEVDHIISEVIGKLIDQLTVKDGVVEPSAENAKALTSAVDVFDQAVSSSEYYPLIVAFVSDFSSQVGEFQAFYEKMRESFRNLPRMELSKTDRGILTHYGGAAVPILTQLISKASTNLGTFLARSLTEQRLSTIVSGVSDIIRKTNNVEPMARDHLLLFFRIVGNTVYRSVEEQGISLRYACVGPVDETNREFCAKLVGFGRSFTRQEIDSMDNGQVHGVFDNIGGYGCRHFWKIADGAPVRTTSREAQKSPWIRETILKLPRRFRLW